MPSPFPGMDPYLEEAARWPDVHQRLITYLGDALQPRLRPRYFARLGERVYLALPHQTMYPDIAVVQRPARESATPYSAGEAAPPITVERETPEAPVIVTVHPVEHREPMVEIVQADGEAVVTVIEALSPANKAVGEGQRQYRRKQESILESETHLVEIDLLAGGQPTLAIPREALALLPAHRYLISVSRAPDRNRFETYPIALAQALPKVNIPLKAPDTDIPLDLQSVLAECYDKGGYGELVNYRLPPRTSLSVEEAAWLEKRLTSAGLRP
jgi:Protein of unknown function (DUF4058)